MKNISKLFYKEYFDDFSNNRNSSEIINYNYLFETDKNRKKIIEEANKKILIKRNGVILNAPFFSIPHYLQYKDVASNTTKFNGQTIQRTIQYPGLVTGVGINHEAKIEGEFKLGVHFDYTYGMPVIYGSSVKGLLRSAFPESEDVINRERDAKKKEKRIKIRGAKIKLIKRYLESDEIGITNIDTDALRDHIFEGIGELEDGKIGPMSIYKRDIFFDAVIIEPHKKKDGTYRILDADSITPHIHKGLTYEQSMLKNPTPLTFLKIASGVKMEFRFDLKPAKINGINITAEQKRLLFIRILEDFGIGAKTNVGYGQFSEISEV